MDTKHNLRPPSKEQRYAGNRRVEVGRIEIESEPNPYPRDLTLTSFIYTRYHYRPRSAYSKLAAI